MYDTAKPYTKKILELIQETWKTPFVSVTKGVYPIFEKKFSYPEVDHTDGIGTKGIYHWERRTFRNAVLDALAMGLNDLALARATPYKLQNHLILPTDDHGAILEIIQVLAQECRKRNIAITGGETSIHNAAAGIELSITLSGFLGAGIQRAISNKLRVGDVLIGLKSNGLHANGFTRVRKIFGGEYRTEFTDPTAIYSDTILDLDKRFDISGMMHITGGAYTKLKSLLHNADVEIVREHQLQPHQIFKELYRRGVSDGEMYRTFNCGIGFIFSVKGEDADDIVSEVSNCAIVGSVVPGTGKVKIESAFSEREIVL